MRRFVHSAMDHFHGVRPVFSQARFEITPKINALAVIMVGASVALTFAAEYFRTRRAEKKLKK